MKLETILDGIHTRTVHNKLLQLFTAGLRILLAIPFVYSGIPKIMNQPFTILPRSDPVGAYFAALYDTGYYYNFLGWSQLAAALLLLFPRTSHIGALMFLPIIVNITVLTNSVGFRGTWLVTILMSLACVYLVCWDYPRWKSVLFSKGSKTASFSGYEYVLIPVLAGTCGASIIAVFGILAGEAKIIRPLMIAVWFGFGAVFGILVAIHHRFMKFETAGVNDLIE